LIFCNNDRENSLLLFLLYGACVKQNTIFLLTKNADYTVSYSNNINAGSVTVTIMEIGSYEGTTGTTFQITSRSIGEITVEKIGKSTVFFGGGVVQYFI
jgi:hypothetical protein